MRAPDDAGAPPSTPSFSVVICTDGRAEALRAALRSLRYLDYPRFEVCVVCGPSEDGTRDVLAEEEGHIKVAHNTERNLSMSRNIGISLASGDVVAFIDDDCIPEPEWLAELATAYADPAVGGAGGFVYDHLGTGFQARYTTANRLGHVKSDWADSVTQLSFPFTANFPHLLGANSSFRRHALVEIGGFDEEYDYYLDETDVAVRLVDAGWVVATIDGAYVHHKFLPSSMRTVERGYRILRNWFSVIKNQIYFSLRHRGAQYGLDEVMNDARAFIEGHARDLDWAISEGLIPEKARSQFWKEVEQAWAVGLRRGFENTPRLITEATLQAWASPFTPFPATIPEGGRRTFCFVSQEYTPGKMGGIGRYTHELASGIASMGHHVHVIAKADGHDRIDFEDGVWVHRLMDKPAHVPQPDGLRLPEHLWDRATTVTRELDAIAARRPITAVSAPIWDCEGIAVLTDGRYPLLTTLHTSMASFLAANPTRAADHRYVRKIARPALAAETRLMTKSYKIVANSHAIVDEIEHLYGIQLDPSRLALIPHGMSDWTRLPQEAPADLPAGSLRLLFVGRLEERKGIDVLLACAKRVLARHTHVYLDIVGNDTIPGPRGRAFRAAFEADHEAAPVLDRVTFHGSVSDERLRGFYQACDIFVAPSRFESFGLMLVEGMMFGKPVIGCEAGGMVEVVEAGVSGLLARPGDVASLEACVERLITDADVRVSMGAAARKRYEERFTAQRMVAAMVEELKSAAEAHAATAERESKALSVVSLPARDGPPKPVGMATTTRGRSRPSVVIVAAMLARYDAISAAVRDTYRMLAGRAEWDVRVLTTRNDYTDVPAQLVDGVAGLLLHPAYLNADLILYHFGIFHELFDALVVGNGHAAQVAYFHNITPEEFATPEQAEIIRKSFRQVANLAYADEIWPVSQVNEETLREHGISGDHIHVLPLVVEEPGLLSPRRKRSDRLELLFMGRAVPSKGLLDLVKALALARHHVPGRIRLRVAGSLEWSDRKHLAEVRRSIREHRLDDIVELCGVVNDKRRETLYHEAHILAIPSYHEGFCKPVVEGLRSGCIPVGYASYNVPYVANGFGRLVATGDWQALAAALSEVGASIAAAQRAPDEPALPLDRGRASLREFEAAIPGYVETFAFEQIATITRARVAALLSRQSEGDAVSANYASETAEVSGTKASSVTAERGVGQPRDERQTPNGVNPGLASWRSATRH